MFKNKQQLDNHVRSIQSHLKSDKDRNLRGLNFSQLYFKIGEYEMSRRYICDYLTVNDKSSVAYKQLGLCLDALGQKEKAFSAYKTSLELEPKQPELLLKVCDILLHGDVVLDPNRTRYWCELAESQFPSNNTVFRLKEKMVEAQDANPMEIKELILKELALKPSDPFLRVRYLQHLLQQNLITEAFDYAQEIECKNVNALNDNVKWYDTCIEILQKYKIDMVQSKVTNWKFWLFNITVLEKQASLALSEVHNYRKSMVDCANALVGLDQGLNELSKCSLALCETRELSSNLIVHFQGQLCFHLATFLFKKAKKDHNLWKETIKHCSPLLLLAFHFAPPDLQDNWLSHTSEANRQIVQKWNREGSYRCSQAGHTILSCITEKKGIFMDRISNYCSGSWREKLYKIIFSKIDHVNKMSSSCFVNNEVFKEPMLTFPSASQLKIYDKVSQRQYPNSLHHLVWIGLAYQKNLWDLKCNIFEGLQYSINNLANCNAECLNQLDMDTFTYCTVMCTGTLQEESVKSGYISSDKPSVLPANIMEPLCTEQQSKWWAAAFKLYKNDTQPQLGDLRITLTRGIEVIRCVGQHGLDAKLLCNLAHIFSERVKNGAQSERHFLEARVGLFYSSAYPLLQRLKSQQVVCPVQNRLFNYNHKELKISEIIHLIEEVKMFQGMQLMNDGDHEKALDTFHGMKTPYASFQQGIIYKKLAEEQLSSTKENLTSEMRSKHIIMLSKARDCFHLTLDRLRESKVNNHPLDEVLASHMEEVEEQLSRIDPDTCGNRNDCEIMSEDNISSVGSLGENILLNLTNSCMNNTHNQMISTPKHKSRNISQYLSTTNYDIKRTESRPSPERLDAQIRNLTIKREHDMNSLMEIIHQLVDEIKDLKCTVDQGSKNHKKLIEELKSEVSELKKTVNKTKVTPTPNLDEQDFRYLLEEELQNQEYSMSNLYQNYPPQRVPPNPNLNYSPHMYQNSVYPMYPPYATVPYVENQQVADLRNQVLNQQFMYNQAMFNKLNQPDSLSMLQAMNSLYPQSSTQDLGGPLHNKPEMNFLDQQSGVSSQTSSQSLQPLSQPSQSNIMTNTSIAPVTTQINKPQSFKTAPANVVISNSDPLPAHTLTSVQSTLSVTIPAHHIKTTTMQTKGIHNYQIAMPNITTTSTPSIYGFTDLAKHTPEAPKPFSSPFESSASSTPKTILSKTNSTSDSSFGTPNALFSRSNKNTSGDISASSFFSTADTLDINNSSTNTIVTNTLNKSSDTSLTEKYDPLPDFKPIIPLPDVVELKTGEEDEEVLFKARSKLYRFVDKEWKERGIGELKLLSNKATKKVRVLMRRDHTHKVCANHIITHDMTLNPALNETKAYVWHASDFADENVIHEKLCARFKTEDIAKMFYTVFEKARSACQPAQDVTQEVTSSTTTESVSTSASISKDSDNTEKNNKVSFGGFTFSSTPTLKESTNKNSNPKLTLSQETKKETISPFASFSFGSTLSKPTEKDKCAEESKSLEDKSELANVSNDNVEEFIPTAEFTPVIPLPEKVAEQTGEEHENVLFEERSKLLRYDSDTKEWKERGLGNIKILVDKNDDQKVRLLMRREIVLKVCCNHFITKDILFTRMPSEKVNSVTWSANDFSENEMKAEVFAIKFKTKELCDKFYDTVTKAQSKLKDKNTTEKLSKPVAGSKQVGFGDMFKPKPNSWTCNYCYIINDKGLYCIACNSPKDDTVPAKKDDTLSNKNENSSFTFGMPTNSAITASEKKNDSIKGKTNETSTFIFGNTNTPTVQPLSKTSEKKNEVPVAKTETSFKQTGFGDMFKPKPNSWTCKSCYVSNDKGLYCAACNSPKDDTVPAKKEELFGSNKTEGAVFSFGMPATTAPSMVSTPLAFGKKTTSDSARFSFGVPKAEQPSQDPSSNAFKFASPTSTPATSFVFGGNLNASSSDTKASGDTVKSLTTPSGKFEFVFTPKSPKGKSPSKNVSKGETDSAGEEDYVSDNEDDNIHFEPVIPLPEKVDVITGEENEEVLYCHRAKLFRFVDHEWKERGIGDIKILKNNVTKKIRVLMRRSQILKICLNHILTPDIEYNPKDNKTWLFTANDFSEEVYSVQQFCIRFKTEEIAKNFKKAIDEAQASLQGSLDVTLDTSNDDSDVEITFETTVTEEEKNLARKYLLPDNFYAYKYRDDCKGCRGCRSDDYDFAKKESSKESKSTSNAENVQPTSSATGTEIDTLTNKFSLTSSILGQDKTSKAAANNFNFSFTQSQSDTSKNKVDLSQNIFAPKSSELQKSMFSSGFTSENSDSDSSQKPFQSIFGGNTQNITSSNDIFKTSNQSSQSIFGGNKNSFSFASQNTNQSNEQNRVIKPSQFGQSIFGNKTVENQQVDKKQDNPFLSNKSIFGNSSTETNLVKPIDKKDDQKTTSVPANKPFFSNSIFGSFGGPNSNKISTDNSKGVFGSVGLSKIEIKDDVPMFKFDSDLSFTNIASATQKPAFAQGDSNFSFAGAGTPLFSSLKKTNSPNISLNSSAKDKSDDENQDESAVNEEDYDPHYDPIIELPDTIVVSTGEEDETKLFCQRAKLYRYDTDSKEWKERGVGELKILHHPTANTYRLLLRREQVHKLVLNQLLTKDFVLNTLNLSDRAFCWGGINHAEQPGTEEKLAARFKNPDLAMEFKNLVDSIISNLNTNTESSQLDDEYNDDENVDEYEDDDEDEERSVMFHRNAVLMGSTPKAKQFSEIGRGALQIVYDSDLFGARIKFYSDDGECLSNTIIALNTTVTISETECTWSAMDYYSEMPEQKLLKACFESIDDAEEFFTTFKEGVSFAQEADIVDSFQNST
ncbi:E3 SUMO-protein ligase RanBP2-like [Ctenocephalides felis]|uniref:E3 SUMO-protein ligase RanBP2-like n=1 Tax=Ctenocephalides felis TaxID=7515 RepID=UPI000E6E51A5|nr:E3 SUMO-protein ligase RanBP2-like [Ctenocephalides felis]